MTALRLSILIVNFESTADLDACLASIDEHPPTCDFEIIVVDNASRDFDLARAQRDHPGVTFLASTQNLTYTGGNNLAFAHSAGDLLLLLNPDTRVGPAALDAAVTAIEDPVRRPSIVGAYLSGFDGKFQRYYRRLPGRLELLGLVFPWPFGRLPGFRRYLMEDVEFEGIVHVPQPPGAFMLVRRPPSGEDLLEPGFKNFFSDVDLAWRLDRGSRAFVYPGVRVVHRMGGAGLRPTGPVDRIRLRHDYDYGMLRYARTRWGTKGSIPVRAAIALLWLGLIVRSLAQRRIGEVRPRAAALRDLLRDRPPAY